MTRRDADWWYNGEVVRSLKDKLPRAAEAAFEAAGEIEVVQGEKWHSAEEEKWAKESVVVARLVQVFGGGEVFDQFRTTYLDNPDRVREINELIHKVEHPMTVQSFEEARSIARRLHEFTGIAVHVYFMTLFQHILKERVLIK